MSPAEILSSVGNSESAARSSRGSQPGYSAPGFIAAPRALTVDAAIDDGLVEALTDIRDAARGRGEYATADRLRDLLRAMGAQPGDTKIIGGVHAS